MSTPQEPGREAKSVGAVQVSRHAFDAIGRRDAAAVLAVTTDDVHVEVRSDLATGNFEHRGLWQDVTVDGREQVHDYLVQLFGVLPSVTIVTIVRNRRDDSGAAEFTAELAGVTTEGKPFDAAGLITVSTADGRINRLRADISHMAVGPQLLRRTDHNPRRYFEYFLEEAGGTPASEGARGAA